MTTVTNVIRRRCAVQGCLARVDEGKQRCAKCEDECAALQKMGDFERFKRRERRFSAKHVKPLPPMVLAQLTVLAVFGGFVLYEFAVMLADWFCGGGN